MRRLKDETLLRCFAKYENQKESKDPVALKSAEEAAPLPVASRLSLFASALVFAANRLIFAFLATVK